MSTQFGQIPSGVIIPQPGFDPSQNEQGGWVANRDYFMSKETWETSSLSLFNRGNYITAIDSNAASIYNFLRIDSKSVIYQEGEIVGVRVSFSGSPTAQYGESDIGDDALPTYRLNCSLSEVDLADHPKWKDLAKFERITLGKLLEGFAEWIYSEFDADYAAFYPRTGTISAKLPDDEQLVTSDAIAFAGLIAEGKKTYLKPVITWTEDTQGNVPLNAAQLNSLGRISVPRGNPPTPNGGRNWMLTNATQDSRGETNVYRTMLEWTLSERGGHDSFLYDT